MWATDTCWPDSASCTLHTGPGPVGSGGQSQYQACPDPSSPQQHCLLMQPRMHQQPTSSYIHQACSCPGSMSKPQPVPASPLSVPTPQINRLQPPWGLVSVCMISKCAALTLLPNLAPLPSPSPTQLLYNTQPDTLPTPLPTFPPVCAPPPARPPPMHHPVPQVLLHPHC
jgi:hypothetical protein